MEEFALNTWWDYDVLASMEYNVSVIFHFSVGVACAAGGPQICGGNYGREGNLHGSRPSGVYSG